MRIEKLKLKDFRNYQSLELYPHPGLNLLFGQNGSGKTNLLEAVHYCALGRSHRTSLDKEVVRKGALMGACGVTVIKNTGTSNIAVKLTPGQPRKKTVLIGGKKAPRLSDLMGQLRCVIFSPEDLLVVKEGPALRRKVLDMLLSQCSTGYFVALQQYQAALEQRNALIRETKRTGAMQEELFQVFEEAMAQPAQVLVTQRRWIMKELSQMAEEKYGAISGRAGEVFHLSYESCMKPEDDPQETMRTYLQRNRQEDIRRGTTGWGVHREDMGLQLNGRDMKQYASQGQIRTAALSIKLAQLDVFRMETGESPVLLLDDVMSELDMTRRTRLLREIEGVQTFVTCTDETDLDGCMNRRTHRVELQRDGTARVIQVHEGEQMPAEPPLPDDLE